MSYTRLYATIPNDERFAGIYTNAAHFGTYAQLLMVADAMYPADAPLPIYVNRRSLGALVEAGLVELCANHHYRIHGLAAERERRSAAARVGGKARSTTVSERSANASERSANASLAKQEQEHSKSRDAREIDDGRLDLEAWLLVKFRAPSPAQRQFLDAYQAVFDETGPARAERIILSNPADPIGALKADLATFREERRAAADKAERKPPPPKRRGGGLTGINAELAAMFTEQYGEPKP